MPKALISSLGIVSLPAPAWKYLRDLCVCAPQYRSDGTAMSPIVSFSIRVSAMTDFPFVAVKIPQERDGSCVKVIHVNFPWEAIFYSLGARTLSCSLLARLAAVGDRFAETFIPAAEGLRHQMLVGHQLPLYGKAIRSIARLLQRFDLRRASGRI